MNDTRTIFQSRDFTLLCVVQGQSLFESTHEFMRDYSRVTIVDNKNVLFCPVRIDKQCVSRFVMVLSTRSCRTTRRIYCYKRLAIKHVKLCKTESNNRDFEAYRLPRKLTRMRGVRPMNYELKYD